MLGYDYEINYKKGKENVMVDALSRKYEEEGSLFALSLPVTNWIAERDLSIIMVVVDKLSKYAHLCAIQHPFKPSTVAQVFVDWIFKLNGVPNSTMKYHHPTLTN